ncbi:MAG: histidine phosphatase family protein [Acidimicrobiales bacterium]
MARLHLVRHGKAASAWGERPDPGLDELGRAQAAATARDLAGLGPLPIVSSPRRRAQETAAPLADRWGVEVRVDERWDEVPSPSDEPAVRREWLASALASRWEDLGDEVAAWRTGLVEACRSTAADAVVVTHFVAINAVVAEAEADHAVTVFLPANASVTVIDVDDDGCLRVVARGSEAPPEVG